MKIGTLVWFDVSSGEGMMEVDGKAMYIHYTTIDGIDKNKYVGPKDSDRILLSNLKSGDKAKVTVYSNIYSDRIETADFNLQNQD
jgi:hypothetical protein